MISYAFSMRPRIGFMSELATFERVHNRLTDVAHAFRVVVHVHRGFSAFLFTAFLTPERAIPRIRETHPFLGPF